MIAKLPALGAGFAIGLVLVVAGPAGAAFPGANGKIAFQRGSSTPQIYVSDSVTVTPLTSVGANGQPTWNQNGRKIAFTSSRGGNSNIWAMNPNGSGQTPLTEHPLSDADASWSPTGLIAFESERDDGLHLELYTMNEDGSDEKRRTFGPESNYDPAFSPTGNKIAFASDRTGYGDIYLMNPDGTGQIQLTSGPASDSNPSWSPDGQKIAFQRDGDIYVTTTHPGTGAIRYTDDPAYEMLPAFSPDGKLILFARLRSGFNYDIYSVSVQNVHDVRSVLSDSAAENAPDMAATRPCTGICPP
jgi:Tol biopolymer transport system component